LIGTCVATVIGFGALVTVDFDPPSPTPLRTAFSDLKSRSGSGCGLYTPFYATNTLSYTFKPGELNQSRLDAEALRAGWHRKGSAWIKPLPGFLPRRASLVVKDYGDSVLVVLGTRVSKLPWK
jgi:hypothetical protein